MTRLLAFALVAVLALSVAACGGSGGGSSGEATEEEEASTPQEALAELQTVRRMLRSALADYRAGRADQAEETVGDAYLEHYEHVEGPLGERDHDLMEEIEEAVSTELRDTIKDGAPADEVAALVADVEKDIDRAEAALR